MSVIPKKIEILEPNSIKLAFPSDAKDYMLESAEKIEHNLGRFTRATRKIAKIFQSKETAENKSLTKENKQLYHDFTELYEFFKDCTKDKEIEEAKEKLDKKNLQSDAGLQLSEKASKIMNNIKDNAEIKNKLKKITTSNLQGTNYTDIINNIITSTSLTVKKFILPNKDNPENVTAELDTIKNDFKGYCNAMIAKFSKGEEITKVMGHTNVKDELKKFKKNHQKLKKIFNLIRTYIDKNKLIQNGTKKYPELVKQLNESIAAITEKITLSDSELNKMESVIYYGETLKDVGTNADFKQGIDRFISPLVKSAKDYNKSVINTKKCLESSNPTKKVKSNIKNFLDKIKNFNGNIEAFNAMVLSRKNEVNDEQAKTKKLRKYQQDVEKINLLLQDRNDHLNRSFEKALSSKKVSQLLKKNTDFDNSIKGSIRDVLSFIGGILSNILSNLVYYLPLLKSVGVMP